MPSVEGWREAKANEILTLASSGVSLSEIARQLSIGKASVHLILKSAVGETEE